jgi:hypothetical protein
MSETSTRPTFLTVLCILTFIGSGWGIFDSTIDYFMANSVDGFMETFDEQMDEAIEDIESNSDLDEDQQKTIIGLIESIGDSLTEENIRASSVVSLVSDILTLLGAIFMWRLRKLGYWVYILGWALLIVGMAVIFPGILGIAMAAGFGFLGVLFSILYGVNLKHLN